MMTRAHVRRLGPDLCRRVAMPRFRKAEVKPVRLTDAVHRVLLRALSNSKSFGVFVFDGRLLLSTVESVRFQQLERRWPNQLLGTYGPGVKVSDLVDDFKEHFTDEVEL